MPGQRDRLGGRVRTGTGHHRHPAMGGLDADFDHALAFVMAEGRRFAGSADRHQAMGALGDLPLDEITTRFLVRLPLRSEEPTSELQSLMRISYADFFLQKTT